MLDEHGDGAPLLRGAVEAFSAIAPVARWEARRARAARMAGPWRADWPALAADRTSFGAGPDAVEPPAPLAGADSGAAPSARASTCCAAAGLPVTAAIAVPDADAAAEAARPLGGRPVALKLDAAGLAHKSDLGLVALGLPGDDAVRAAADDLLEIGAPARARRPRACSSSRWPTRASS